MLVKELQNTMRARCLPNCKIPFKVLFFYRDACLKAVASEEQAIFLVSDLKAVCATNRFRLIGWVSTVAQCCPRQKQSKINDILI